MKAEGVSARITASNMILELSILMWRLLCSSCEKISREVIAFLSDDGELRRREWNSRSMTMCRCGND